MLLGGIALLTALFGPPTKDQAAAEAARFCLQASRVTGITAAAPKALGVEERPSMPGLWLVAVPNGHVMVSKVDGRVRAAVFRGTGSPPHSDAPLPSARLQSLVSSYAKAANYGVQLKVKSTRRLPGADELWQVDAVPCWGKTLGSYRHAAAFQLDSAGALRMMSLRLPPKPPKDLKAKLGATEADAKMAAQLLEAYSLPAVLRVRPAELAVWKADSSFEKDWRDQACKDRAKRNEGTLVYNAAYVLHVPGSDPESSPAVYETFLDARTGQVLVASRFGKERTVPPFDWQRLDKRCDGFVYAGRFFGAKGGAVAVASPQADSKVANGRKVFLTFGAVHVNATFQPKDGSLAVLAHGAWTVGRPSADLRSALDKALRRQ